MEVCFSIEMSAEDCFAKIRSFCCKEAVHTKHIHAAVGFAQPEQEYVDRAETSPGHRLCSLPKPVDDLTWEDMDAACSIGVGACILEGPFGSQSALGLDLSCLQDRPPLPMVRGSFVCESIRLEVECIGDSPFEKGSAGC